MARYNKNKALNYRESLLMTRDIADPEVFEKLFSNEVDLGLIKKELSDYDKAVDFVDKHVYNALNQCFGGKQGTSDSDINVLLKTVTNNRTRIAAKAQKLRAKAKPNILLENDIKVYEDAEMILNRIVEKRYKVMSVLTQVAGLEDTVNNIAKLKSEINSIRKQIETREKANIDGALNSELDSLRSQLATKANQINVLLDKRYTINFYLRKAIGNLSTFTKDYMTDLTALSNLFGKLKSGKEGNTAISTITLQGINHRISRMNRVCERSLTKVATKQREINTLYKKLGIMPNNASKRVNDRLRGSSSAQPATVFTNPTVTPTVTTASPEVTSTHETEPLQRITDRYAYIKKDGMFYIFDGDTLRLVTDQNGLDNFIATEVFGIGNTAQFTVPDINYSYSINKDGKVVILKNGEFYMLTNSEGLERFKNSYGVEVSKIPQPEPVKLNTYYYFEKNGKIVILEGDKFYKLIEPYELDNFIQTIGAPVINISPTNSIEKPYYYYFDKNDRAHIFQGDEWYGDMDRQGLNDFISRHNGNVSEIQPAGSRVEIPVQQVISQPQPVSQSDINVEMMAEMLQVSTDVASKIVGLYSAKKAGLIDEDTYNTAKDAILGVTAKKEKPAQKSKKSSTKKNTNKKRTSKTNKDDKIEEAPIISEEKAESSVIKEEESIIQSPEIVNEEVETIAPASLEKVEEEQITTPEHVDSDVDFTYKPMYGGHDDDAKIDPEKYELLKQLVSQEDTIFESTIKDTLGCDKDTAVAYFNKLIEDGIISGNTTTLGDVIQPQEKEESIEPATVEEVATTQEPQAVIPEVQEVTTDNSSSTIEPEVKEETISTSSVEPVSEESQIPEVSIEEKPIVQEQVEEVTQPEIAPINIEPTVQETVQPVQETEVIEPEIITDIPAEFIEQPTIEEQLQAERTAPVETERPSLEPSDFARDPLDGAYSPVKEVDELIQHDPSVIPDETDYQAEASIQEGNVSKVESAEPTTAVVYGGAVSKVQGVIAATRDSLVESELNDNGIGRGGHNL